MAKRNGLRIFVLTLVGAATLVCLVFAGLLVRLAIRTLNTTEEQVAARGEKEEQVDQAFQDAFGEAEGEEGGFGIQIDMGGLPTPGVPSSNIPTPPVVAGAPGGVTAPAPAEGTPVVAGSSQTITLDIDAQGQLSYEGQPLNEAALSEFLSSLSQEAKIVLDVHPSCDEEMAQLWQLVCFQNGFPTTTQRVADLPH